MSLLEDFRGIAEVALMEHKEEILSRIDEACKDVIIEKKFSKKEAEQFKCTLREIIDKDEDEAEEIFKDKNVIVIILESPHKNEYTIYKKENNEKLYNSVPALGKTGKNIEEYLDEILKNQLKELQSNDEYLIILMNSIQYPCSLFEPTERHRSQVFEDCWNKKYVSEEEDIYLYREDFKKRLKSYNPSIVINACTGNTIERNKKLSGYLGERKNLNVLVQKEIDDLIEKKIIESKLYQIHHPCRWNKDTELKDIP